MSSSEPAFEQTTSPEDGHPLGGQKIKYDENGIIDFSQFINVLVFCHKISAIELNGPTREIKK